MTRVRPYAVLEFSSHLASVYSCAQASGLAGINAHSLELNVWTSTVIESIERDEAENDWIVALTKNDGTKRIMRPKHIVLALGIGGNEAKMPTLPGMNEFQGKIVHSTAHKTATDFLGKKAVVVGACTSAHDIAQDFQSHGVDVTIVQRSSTCVISVRKGVPVFFSGLHSSYCYRTSGADPRPVGLYEEGGPPIDTADRINASFPNHVLKLIHKHQMKQVIENDKETLEGLKKVGFQINYGEDDAGFLMMAWKRAGGYYLDVGASQLIIDGKIKLKRGSVKSLTKDSIVFEDGSSLKADVVVFATGLGDVREPTRKLIGDKLTSQIGPVWGLSHEGELNSLWRHCGVPNLYFMMGNLALCRFHSTHIALQIKAKEEGLYTSPYNG